MHDYRALLEERLIEAGTTGLRQRDIVHSLQYAASADELVTHLQALLDVGKVQAFDIPSGPRGGRPTRIWRATTLILEE